MLSFSLPGTETSHHPAKTAPTHTLTFSTTTIKDTIPPSLCPSITILPSSAAPFPYPICRGEGGEEWLGGPLWSPAVPYSILLAHCLCKPGAAMASVYGPDYTLSQTTPTPCRGRFITPTADLSALRGCFHFPINSSMTMIAPHRVVRPTLEADPHLKRKRSVGAGLAPRRQVCTHTPFSSDAAGGAQAKDTKRESQKQSRNIANISYQ